MADVKISGLPTATTPVAGTEVLPIVQGGQTRQVSINNLTSGKTVPSTGFVLEASGVITESGTTRTLAAGDNGKIIYCTSGSAVTINCAAGLGAGFTVTIIQGGAGKVTVAPNSQTLVSSSGLYATLNQYAVISLICPVANTFLASGNLGA
jgi:hypothetical protein